MDRVLGPLDDSRSLLIRLGASACLPFLADRELRVATSGILIAIGALGLALYWPAWPFLLAPLVLGVPHLVADLRFLVARPGLHRRPTVAAAVGVPLAGVCVGLGPQAGVAAMLGALLVARGSTHRRALGGGFVALVAWAAALHPSAFPLLLAHGHNLAALAFWLAWRPRHRSLHLLVLGLVLGGSLVVLSGARESHVVAALASDERLAWGWGLVRGLPAPWDVRILILYGFLQSVHYGVWLRLVPDEDRRQPAPRSFRASWRALSADLGPWTVPLALTVAAVLGVWALFAPARAVQGYFRLALFHGYLELAAAVLWYVERWRR